MITNQNCQDRKEKQIEFTAQLHELQENRLLEMYNTVDMDYKKQAIIEMAQDFGYLDLSDKLIARYEEELNKQKGE